MLPKGAHGVEVVVGGHARRGLCAPARPRGEGAGLCSRPCAPEVISADGVCAEVMEAPGCGEMDAIAVELLTALLGAGEVLCGLG